MHKKHPLLLVLTLVAVAVATSTAAHAHTATRFFEIKIVDLPERGSAAKVQGIVHLENAFKEDAFQVVLRYAEYYDLKGKRAPEVSSERMKVGAGGDLKIPFGFKLNGDGKHQVMMEVVVFSASGGMQLGHQHIDLYFVVNNGQYQRSTYEKLYVPDIKEVGENRPYPIIGRSIEAAADARVVPLPAEVKGVLGVDRLKLRALPKPKGTGSKGSPVGRNSETRSQPEAVATLRHDEDPRPWWGHVADLSLPRSAIHVLDGLSVTGIHHRYGLGTSGILAFGGGGGTASTYTVSGRFSYRGLDNNLHPGWNWFVQLWWRKSDGNWSKLSSAYIPPSGNWSLSFSQSGYSGQHLLIQYRAGSYFIMPQDQNNNEYWWSDPEQTNIPTNFNIGHRVADTSNSGTLAGLGDVHNSAYLYWNKFTINGVNPERSQAIRLFFPNTWNNCGGTSPWSCASVGGDIWLIAAHTDNCTIQHELSHQTNNEYWNNERPPGAGGPHLLNNCYNTGLALREGFANAVPHWVLDGENSTDPSACGFQLESPDPAVVCNGDTNEVWVAATFWDLLDRPTDGQDVLWFNNAVDVFSIYLNAGVDDGIRDYRDDYRNAASTGHEGFIDDIYENNTIPVP